MREGRQTGGKLRQELRLTTTRLHSSPQVPTLSDVPKKILYEIAPSRDGRDRVSSGSFGDQPWRRRDRRVCCIRSARSLARGWPGGYPTRSCWIGSCPGVPRRRTPALAAEAAFAALVARHGPMVLGVCRRALADPNDVEDAFQATFLVLVRRARSVRVGDSLGRWLYGVARRVAAKAQARCERARVRSVPLEREPVASEPPADRIELLAALDEEVSRLPEKYLAPVVLCDLEGLTHAQAAARLRWPVGTVSGRLSRARDLLRNRLVRRGMAPTAGSMVALLATEGARAAVSEPLAAATVQAATRLAMGSGSQAGVASVSASALSLMNAVLRAAVMAKLKVAAAVLLASRWPGPRSERGSASGPARQARLEIRTPDERRRSRPASRIQQPGTGRPMRSSRRSRRRSRWPPNPGLDTRPTANSD